VTDALLGAAVLGDIGEHFPSDNADNYGADSMAMLARVVSLAAESGFIPAHVDVTVVAGDIAIAPHRESIRVALAGVLGLNVDAVSVKATTTDGLGFVGRGEGLAAVAVVTVQPSP
jgi:2-C-methyl-D-erythritol 2,4-cyclodiphosphate synthase